MKKITISLFTQDETYASYFIKYNRQLVDENRYVLAIYTNLTTFKQAISNRKFDVLLTDELEIEFAKGNFSEVIYLSELAQNEDKKIYKYRPIDNILSFAIAQYFESNQAMDNVINEDTGEKIVTFYSGAGNEGKTTLALCLAKALTQFNKKVIYLNLEYRHTMNLYFKDEKQSSIELFYYLKNNLEKLTSKIESLKTKHFDTGIDYIYFPISPEEIRTLTKENIDELIQSIKRTNQYDYIIVDVDTTIDEKTERLLQISDQLFWVLDHTEKSFYLSKYLLDHKLDWLNESHDVNLNFVLNKNKDVMFPSIEEYNFSISDRVENQAHWESLNESEKLQIDTEVGRQLLQILNNETLIQTEVK